MIIILFCLNISQISILRTFLLFLNDVGITISIWRNRCRFFAWFYKHMCNQKTCMHDATYDRVVLVIFTEDMDMQYLTLVLMNSSRLLKVKFQTGKMLIRRRMKILIGFKIWKQSPIVSKIIFKSFPECLGPIIGILQESGIISHLILFVESVKP